MSFDYNRKLWGVNKLELDSRYLSATRLKYALLALNKIKKGKILEVGCGGGSLCRALKKYKPKFDIYGLDVSIEAIKAAKLIDEDIKYIKGDVYKLSFDDNSFDVVISFDLLEHLNKYKLALKEIYRILKPGGIFHFFVPLEGSKFNLARILPRKIYDIKKDFTGHVQAFTKKQLFNDLQLAGYKIVDDKNSCFFFYQFADLSYFLWLKLIKRKNSNSIESYLYFNRHKKTLENLKNLFSRIFYWENEIFKLMPGGGLHVTAVKEA